MKIKYIFLAALLALTLTFFVGCKAEEQPSGADTSDAAEESSAEAEEPKEEFVILSADKKTEYKLVSFINSTAYKNDIENFQVSLRTKLGAEPKLTYTTTDIPAKSIVLGTYADLSGKVEGLTQRSWTSYDIYVEGETVYVAVSGGDYLLSVFTEFIEQIRKVEKGVWGIKMDCNVKSDVCGISETVPQLEISGNEKFSQLHNCGNGNYQAIYTNFSDLNKVNSYKKALADLGYTAKQTNIINENVFGTYIKGDTQIHFNYYPELKQFRIVYGEAGYMPATEAVTGYQKVTTPTFAQMKVQDRSDTITTGLNLVFQLEDGSFVIIDGGRNFDADRAFLLNYLKTNAPAGTKPQVTWMFTHIHSDHTALATKFIEENKNEFDLNLVCWNMPDFATMTCGESTENALKLYTNLQSAITNAFPNTNYYVFHSGEKMYLPGCEIVFLMTPEDYYPKAFDSFNDTSCAWKMTLSGKTFMIFGDCTTGVNNQTLKCYDTYLKSDVMQVPHHGAGCASLALYKAVDPDICIWSVNQEKFETDARMLGTNSSMKYNAWLRGDATYGDGARLRRHYHQSVLTVLDIPSLKAR